MPARNNRVAITFSNLVQFYSMQKSVDAMLAADIPVDIIVPIGSVQKQPVRDETYEHIKEAGYNPMRDLPEPTPYQILLDPLAQVSRHSVFKKINFQFRIRYLYSLMTAKPDLVYAPPRCDPYDAMLCHSRWEADALQAYCKTYLVAPSKFIGFTKDTHRVSEKPALLYLPTFGDANSVDGFGQAFHDLREHYHVMVKAHHMSGNIDRDQLKLKILQDDSDEFYDHKTNLVELLGKADVVLSDNSGSIFEAIYAEVPLAIYHPTSINSYRYGNIDTHQYRLVESGVVPYTNDVADIGKILSEAMTLRDAQKAAKADFASTDGGTDAFMGVIKHYLELDRASDGYYCLVDNIRQYRAQTLEDAVNKQPVPYDLKRSRPGQILSRTAKAFARRIKRH